MIPARMSVRMAEIALVHKARDEGGVYVNSYIDQGQQIIIKVEARDFVGEERKDEDSD